MHELNALPNFPEFRRINPSDKSWYDSFYQQMPPYADWCFGNLLIWLDQNDDLELSHLNNAVVIRYTSVLKANEHIYNIFGKDVQDSDVAQLLSFVKSADNTPTITEVAEICAQNLSEDTFVIEDDRDSFEYVYSTHEHSELPGKAFSRLRRKVGQFRRMYAERPLTWDIQTEIDEDMAQALLANAHEWGFTVKTEEESHATSDTYDNYEADVLPRTLSLFNVLDMQLLTLKYGDETIGFAIYQKLPQAGHVTVNHIKTNYDYHQVFDFFTHILAVNLLTQSIHTMNFEQDLGIPGMRAHKERLRPIQMMQKCFVRAKN